MDKTIKIYLAAILLVVLVIFIIDTFRIKPVDWTPSYSLDHKKPLDLYVFDHEIKNFMPEHKINRELTTPYEYINQNHQKSVYVIINRFIFDTSDTILLNEVAAGSHLFISSENFIKNIQDTLGFEYEDISSVILSKESTLKLSLTNKTWANKQLILKPVNNTYAFVKMNAATTAILGTQTMPDGIVAPNFIRVKYGKGYVYIHNQPQIFSNVSLLYEKHASEYAALVLSYIPKNLPVVWFVGGQTINPDMPFAVSPLSIIFRYPALRASWLIMLYGLLLYILFNAKRRQRIIPEIKPLRNTTIEFVQTIGNLYFQEGNTANIVDKKIIYFLDRIRNRYYLDTSYTDERFAEKLQSKSGKDEKLINEILSFIRRFRQQKTASRTDLMHLNKLIEEFWEK